MLDFSRVQNYYTQYGKEEAFLDAGMSPERAADMAEQIQRMNDEMRERIELIGQE